jgi:hypothetical protein
MDGRAARDSREDALSLEQQPDAPHGVLVRDEDLPIELRDVEDRRRVAVFE